MERVKLSAYTFKESPGVSGPFHKLQYWRSGKMTDAVLGV